MGDEFYRGWGLRHKIGGAIKRRFRNIGISKEARQVSKAGGSVVTRLQELGLTDDEGRASLAGFMAENILRRFDPPTKDITQLPFYRHLQSIIANCLNNEEPFRLPAHLESGSSMPRSKVWEFEDELKKSENVLDNFDDVVNDLTQMFRVFVSPLVKANPSLLSPTVEEGGALHFSAPIDMLLNDFPEIVEQMVQLPFAPEFEEYGTTENLRQRLEYNLIVASGGMPGDPSTHPRVPRLPTKAPPMSPGALTKTYLSGTPLADLFDCDVPISLPSDTRFEHQHIVAGSGHGKTQTLQHLILHDLEQVGEGAASVVVIDSQGDLIKNISGLSIFAPGSPMADRLVVIDPTDVEFPVALNLFDVGMERINQYSQLDRERMINGVLELYDFVLGSLLDAAMTQKTVRHLPLYHPPHASHTRRNNHHPSRTARRRRLGKIPTPHRATYRISPRVFRNRVRQPGIRTNQETGSATPLGDSRKPGIRAHVPTPAQQARSFFRNEPGQDHPDQHS